MRTLPVLLIELTALLGFMGAAASAVDAEKPQHPLAFETGKVTVGASIATIDLPEGYRYLQAADARYVMEKIYKNPPDPETIGLVMPTKGESDDGPSWIAVVTYSEDEGHVKDDDAKTLDYDKLLKDMQQGARDSMDERRKQGYDTYELLGWAEPPHYDQASHKLYWAQSARFAGSPEPTLNYNIRLLGRKGVLVINAIDSISALPQVATGAKAVLAKTEFTSGNRYEDFKPGYDKVAAYGIGGLIAGGLLLKTGFFALIGKFLIVMIKPLIFGVVVLGGLIAKLFGRGKKTVKPQDQV